MTAESVALTKADELLKELEGGGYERAPSPASSMGRLQKVAYTHESMIELIIEGSSRPGGISQREIAAHFGYTEGWISNVLASEAFQARLAERREELIDPALRATIKERFEALVIQSLEVLQRKLSAPVVSDTVALRAAELGARALGVGGHAPPPRTDTGADRLERLAGRLIDLQSNIRGRIIDAQSTSSEQVPQGS